MSRLEASAEIRVILETVLGDAFTRLHAHPEFVLAPEELERMQHIVAERRQHIPLAYILGEAVFRDFRLRVDHNVLIPRPESEHLIDLALERLIGVDSPIVLDIGTGSGCLAIAMVRAHPTVRVMATDISPEALQIARHNAYIHGVADRIDFRCTDLIDSRSLDTQFSLVLSNPPYIGIDAYRSLSREVLNEPFLALVGDVRNDTGLMYYERILGLGVQTPYYVLEIDPDLTDSIIDMCSGRGWSAQVSRDLQNNLRYMIVTVG